MKKSIILTITIGFIGLCSSCRHADSAASSPPALSGSWENSLVYIEISIARYDGFQPWKLSQSFSVSCFGTAVGPREILTIAEPLADASLIRVKCFGGNEFVPAEIKCIDYDINLCLLTINDESNNPELKAVSFSEDFKKGMELVGNWLAPDGTTKTSRGFLDRALALPCPTSYQRTLAFVVSNPSRQTSSGELYTHNKKGIGIAYSAADKDNFLIPAETILRFLKYTDNNSYAGFGTPGYESYDLLDPSVRKYLKMPEDMKEGNYVSSVYSQGTGSGVLQVGDVVLAINNKPINAYGRYKHPEYEETACEHLIQRQELGQPISFTVWRNGEKVQLETQTSRFDPKEMLVPYQEYDRQPEYMALGGYVFQKLTRDYLRLWGDNWPGKAPPHLFQYDRNLAMKPSEDRKDIVVLSFVLPAPINLGYQNLGRIVVKTFNGLEIRQMSDLLTAVSENPESPFHVVEFEMDYPTLIIPKQNLDQIDQAIAQIYGIQKTVNID